jgi:hypothetical protein
MRLSCSHPVLLHRLAEPKASAMISNALYDILINCFTPPELIGQQGFGNARADVRQEPATHLRCHRKPCASQTSPLTSSMILLD